MFLVGATLVVVAIVILAAFYIGPHRLRSFFASKPVSDKVEYLLTSEDGTTTL